MQYVFPWRAFNGKNWDTALCAKGSEQKLKRLRDEEAWESTAVDFQAYVRPLKKVKEFKYLGRVLITSYDEWEAVVMNLWNAMSRW